MQLVKARVRTWKTTISFSLQHQYKLHRFESRHRRTVRTSGIDEEVLLFLAVPFFQHDLPEPLHHVVIRRKPVCIQCDLFKLGKVKISLAADELFKIFSVKQGL